MRTIGIRELRQQASKHLREVEAGETIEVTDRGRPVARLVPVPMESIGERLIASGRATRASAKGPDLGPPLTPRPGAPSATEIRAEDRADDR